VTTEVPPARRGLRRYLPGRHYRPRGRDLWIGLAALAVVLGLVAGGVVVVVSRGGPRATLSYHGAGFGVVAYSPDGRTVATGGGGSRPGGLAVLWDTAGWRPIAALPTGVGEPVTAVAFSPDGKTLATGGTDGPVSRVWLWDIASRHIVGTLTMESNPPTMSLSFSPDGKTLAVAGDGPVQLWDMASRTPAATLGTQPALVTAFSPDGGLLAVGGLAAGHGATLLWDVRTRQVVATLVEGGSRYLVDSVAFSPDGRSLATGGYVPDFAVPIDFPGHATVWDVAGRRQVGTLAVSGGEGRVWAVAFSSDGRLVAVGGAGRSKDSQVAVWRAADRRLVRTVAKGGGGGVQSLAFSPAGDVLVAAPLDGPVQVWSVGAS
jgi:WD40 repeat protein